MKFILFILIGTILGVWFSWPGILLPKKWDCFLDIIDDSNSEKLSFNAILSISPKYLLKGSSLNKYSKLRIVADACFR